MKRVLFIMHLPPPVHGAAVVGKYVKENQRINRTFGARFINLGTSNSVEEIGRSSLLKILRYFSLILKVTKHLIFFRPQICYITPTAVGVGFYKDIPLIALVKLLGIRTILHYHNKGVRTRQDKNLDNLLYRFVFRNSYIILLSKHLYPDVQKYVPTERVFFCPNGIPDRSEQSELVQKFSDYKTINKPTEILFLSHLIRSKGVLVLIVACKLLKERGFDFHCTIAGDNAELTKDEVEKIIIDKGLGSKITVVGPKNGTEKITLFLKSNVFVLPTFYANECMPLVLIEAMRFSLPIISTFEAAIPEIVDNGITGFLVPQKDSIALADKLEVLIKDQELRQNMGAAGRAKYEREFTLEKFEGRMVEILNEVTASKRSK